MGEEQVNSDVEEGGTCDTRTGVWEGQGVGGGR